MNKKLYLELFLLLICIIYIVYFLNLNYFYDWDTLERSISIKESGIGGKIDLLHFLIRFLPGLLIIPFGFDPLTAYKILTGLFMIVFIMGTYEFVHMETRDNILAFLMGLFLLFNFGFTFLLTTIEDNIWMYAFIILFVYFLFKDHWELAALFLGLGILVHMQIEVYLLMFLSYVLLKLDFINLIKDPNKAMQQRGEQIFLILRKFAISLLFLIVPLIAAYSWLMFGKGYTLWNLINSILVSNFHSDPKFWYFASNRSFIEQMMLAYYGFVSTFVSRWPEFIQDMPMAIYLGIIVLLLLIYVLAEGFSPNLKTLCAVPTFLILFVHDLFYETYSIERWDYLPFFVMYFVTVGYAEKREQIKERLRSLFIILVALSMIFTFVSFNAITSFHASSVNIYADELSRILDNNSVVLETLRPDSERTLYVIYENYPKVVFVKSDMNLNDIFSSKEVYSSVASYNTLSKMLSLNAEQIWTNKYNDRFSIVKLRTSS